MRDPTFNAAPSINSSRFSMNAIISVVRGTTSQLASANQRKHTYRNLDLKEYLITPKDIQVAITSTHTKFIISIVFFTVLAILLGPVIGFVKARLLVATLWLALVKPKHTNLVNLTLFILFAMAVAVLFTGTDIASRTTLNSLTNALFASICLLLGSHVLGYINKINIKSNFTFITNSGVKREQGPVTVIRPYLKPQALRAPKNVNAPRLAARLHSGRIALTLALARPIAKPLPNSVRIPIHIS